MADSNVNIWSQVLEQLANQQQPTPRQVDYSKIADSTTASTGQSVMEQLQRSRANVAPEIANREQAIQNLGGPQAFPSQENINAEVQRLSAPPPPPVAGPPVQAPTQSLENLPVAVQEAYGRQQPQQVAGPPAVPQKAVTQQAPQDELKQVRELIGVKDTEVKGPPKEGVKGSKSKDKWYETALDVMNPILQILGSGVSIYSMAAYGRNGMPQIGGQLGAIGQTLGGLGKKLKTKRQQEAWINTFPAEKQEQVRFMVQANGFAGTQKMLRDSLNDKLTQANKDRDFALKVENLKVKGAEFEYKVSKDQQASMDKITNRAVSYQKNLDQANKTLAKLKEEKTKEKYKDEAWWGENRPEYNQALAKAKESVRRWESAIKGIDQHVQQITSGKAQAPKSVQPQEYKLTKEGMRQAGVKPGLNINANGEAIFIEEID